MKELIERLEFLCRQASLPEEISVEDYLENVLADAEWIEHKEGTDKAEAFLLAATEEIERHPRLVGEIVKLMNAVQLEASILETSEGIPSDKVASQKTRTTTPYW
jgi:hypothetical protein